LPLECAAAAVAHGDDGAILDWAWQRLPRLTNNEAEYAGLLLGLALAQRLRAQQAICVLDSEIVIGQMEGRFAVRSARLRHWHRRACEAARELPVVHFVQIPRAWNRLADGLAAQTAILWPALLAALEKQVGVGGSGGGG
jgi:ribonuclease HI